MRSWLMVFLCFHEGVGYFKERWYEYRRPRAANKKVSLIVSSAGDHVAVAVGNQITIFHKDDDYVNPCGVYTCRCPFFK